MALLVVAVDFGTAYSGYCFSVKGKQENIRSVFWGMEYGFRLPKTPTCILFDENKKFMKFGFDAVMTYTKMNSIEANKFYFIENFKMELYNKTISKNLMICAKNNCPLPALMVFSESLQYLKDHALKTINVTDDIIKYTAEDVTWVLTVPAIWEPAAKQFMRVAAQEAGLIKSIDSENLVIALEPEAASMWCKQLPSTGFISEEADQEKLENHPGVEYIVLDCGGGTVDITVHKVIEDGFLKELHKASGGDWGGIHVDSNFRGFLRDIFHPSLWDTYEKEHPSEVQKLMYDFSVQKCSDQEEDILIPCYYNLVQSVQQKNKNIEEFFENVKGASWSSGSIKIKYEKLKGFYDYSVKKIIAEVQAILETPEINIDYILLVGGFAASRILRQAIRNEFSRRCRVLCPCDAQLAIVKGAVLFGNDPKLIFCRISALTYGVDKCNKFDPAIHDKNKRRVNNAEDYVYCTDLFVKLVEKGKSVGYNQVTNYYYNPVNQNQVNMRFRFFSTEKLNAKYVDEPGIKQIGHFTVNMPDITSGRNRRVRLDIKFGFTELEATATDLTSKETQILMLNFLTEK
ncbi:heat shock 70 kDa protein 12A-like [Erpetoichthys calabaricus]|uniref:heat shock 70 kDa protein 12A-like n=1 Tax=Erpetoichthys calabaricus TaxID=27687 RepID=UPI00223439ED|nr:heat shock 70 kDa protein 12A-like [Erpetoichthys calabaricus]